MAFPIRYRRNHDDHVDLLRDGCRRQLPSLGYPKRKRTSCFFNLHAGLADGIDFGAQRLHGAKTLDKESVSLVFDAKLARDLQHFNRCH